MDRGEAFGPYLLTELQATNVERERKSLSFAVFLLVASQAQEDSPKPIVTQVDQVCGSQTKEDINVGKRSVMKREGGEGKLGDE